jgi:DNA polymerase-1
MVWETRAECPSAAPVLVVHDEVVVEVAAGDAEQAKAWLVDCMVGGMATVLTDVPVVVEAMVEADWSGTPVTADSGSTA